MLPLQFFLLKVLPQQIYLYSPQQLLCTFTHLFLLLGQADQCQLGSIPSKGLGLDIQFPNLFPSLVVSTCWHISLYIIISLPHLKMWRKYHLAPDMVLISVSYQSDQQVP